MYYLLIFEDGSWIQTKTEPTEINAEILSIFRFNIKDRYFENMESDGYWSKVLEK